MQHYGPTTRAFATVEAGDREALCADLVNLWTSYNRAGQPNRMIVDAEYLEMVGVRA